MFVAAVTAIDDGPAVPAGSTMQEQSEPANGAIGPAVITQPALSAGVTVAACLLLLTAAGLTWYVARPQQENVPRTELRQLTFDPGLQRDPTWSPDGQWLAYAADRFGNLDLYRRSMADPTPIPLTTDPADDSQPDWSPDGRWIAFRSERNGGGIYVMPSGGGPAERVTAVGFFPRWSPDGSRLLLRGSMLRGIGSGAFVVNRDGSQLAAVRPDLLRQFDAPHVGWFPDGKRISIAGRRDRATWTFLTAPIEGNTSLTSPSSMPM
jgi:Tol biopolymer transport system component